MTRQTPWHRAGQCREPPRDNMHVRSGSLPPAVAASLEKLRAIPASAHERAAPSKRTSVRKAVRRTDGEYVRTLLTINPELQEVLEQPGWMGPARVRESLIPPRAKQVPRNASVPTSIRGNTNDSRIGRNTVEEGRYALLKDSRGKEQRALHSRVAFDTPEGPTGLIIKGINISTPEPARLYQVKLDPPSFHQTRIIQADASFFFIEAAPEVIALPPAPRATRDELDKMSHTDLVTSLRAYVDSTMGASMRRACETMGVPNRVPRGCAKVGLYEEKVRAYLAERIVPDE